MTADELQALLDAEPEPQPRDHGALLAAIGVALRDALGPYGEQPELNQRWEHSSDEGRRLQVSGWIDLRTLERHLAQRVLDLVTVYAGVPSIELPGESFDDL